MSFPPNTIALNPNTISNIIAQINALEGAVCAELQAIITSVYTWVQQKLNSLGTAAGEIYIIYELLQIPTDLASVLTWIGKIINWLTSLVKPYVTFIEQEAALVIQIAQLAEAIANAATRIGSCTPTIPTLSFPSIPAPPS